MPELIPEWRIVESAEKGAAFSPCRKYRYALWRHWDGTYDPRRAIFIGLNPSTADERQDDPTIRRCMGFAKALGYGGMLMLNAFAFRATSPAVMKAQADPVGEENDSFIKYNCQGKCPLVIACWGVHGTHQGRDQQIAKLVKKLVCFGVTADGSPRHPLYLPKTAKLVEWEAARAKA